MFKEFITAFNLQYLLIPTNINSTIQTAVSLAIVRRKVEEHTSRIQSDNNVAFYNRQRRGNPDNLVYKHYSK